MQLIHGQVVEKIDIMEHKGNEPNVIHGTLHYQGVPEEMQMEIK
jgi:hypothetical protein